MRRKAGNVMDKAVRDRVYVDCNVETLSRNDMPPKQFGCEPGSEVCPREAGPDAGKPPRLGLQFEALDLFGRRFPGILVGGLERCTLLGDPRRKTRKLENVDDLAAPRSSSRDTGLVHSVKEFDLGAFNSKGVQLSTKVVDGQAGPNAIEWLGRLSRDSWRRRFDDQVQTSGGTKLAEMINQGRNADRGVGSPPGILEALRNFFRTRSAIRPSLGTQLGGQASKGLRSQPLECFLRRDRYLGLVAPPVYRFEDVASFF